MSTTLATPSTTFTVVTTTEGDRHLDGYSYYTINITTSLGTTALRDSSGVIRRFSTRNAARKAVAREKTKLALRSN